MAEFLRQRRELEERQAAEWQAFRDSIPRPRPGARVSADPTDEELNAALLANPELINGELVSDLLTEEATGVSMSAANPSPPLPSWQQAANQALAEAEQAVRDWADDPTPEAAVMRLGDDFSESDLWSSPPGKTIIYLALQGGYTTRTGKYSLRSEGPIFACNAASLEISVTGAGPRLYWHGRDNNVGCALQARGVRYYYDGAYYAYISVLTKVPKSLRGLVIEFDRLKAVEKQRRAKKKKPKPRPQVPRRFNLVRRTSGQPH